MAVTHARLQTRVEGSDTGKHMARHLRPMDGPKG